MGYSASVKKYEWLLLAALLVTVSGCGGGGGGGSQSAAPSQNVTVSGVASKGPISDGDVTIYSIVGGVKGSVLATSKTDVNGVFVANFDIELGSSVLVEVSGGTYIDEVTKNTIANPGFRTAISKINANQLVAVTPLTEVAVIRALDAGGLTTTNIAEANALVSNMIGGIRVYEVLPFDASSALAASGTTDEQKQYSLVLGAISKIDSTNGDADGVSEIVASIASDLADSRLELTGPMLLDSLLSVTSDPLLNQTGMTADVIISDDALAMASESVISTYLSSSVAAGKILIDGITSDWEGLPSITEDPVSDGIFAWLDITKVYLTNDTENVYLRVDLAGPAPTQQNAGIWVYFMPAYAGAMAYAIQISCVDQIGCTGRFWDITKSPGDYSTYVLLSEKVNYVLGTDTLEIALPKIWLAHANEFKLSVFTSYSDGFTEQAADNTDDEVSVSIGSSGGDYSGIDVSTLELRQQDPAYATPFTAIYGQSSHLLLTLKASSGEALASYANEYLWSSSDTSVATVNGIGLITGKKIGTTTISVTHVPTSVSAQHQLTIASPFRGAWSYDSTTSYTFTDTTWSYTYQACSASGVYLITDGTVAQTVEVNNLCGPLYEDGGTQLTFSGTWQYSMFNNEVEGEQLFHQIPVYDSSFCSPTPCIIGTVFNKL